MDALNSNLDCNETINQFGVERTTFGFEEEMNVKELTHSQQQPQAPKAHKKKPTIRLTTRVTMLWAPKRSLLYRLLVLDEVKCKTHTHQQRTQ